MVPTRLAEPGAITRTGLRRVLAVLCLTEITSWGVLYYAFPVLAPTISADTGWSTTATAAAFTAGLIVSGAVGVPVGRWLDRYGPRVVMTTGSVVSAIALALIATAPTLPWFFAAWLVAGVAMAGVFYAPAFAALTRWYGDDRVSALTTLTLVGGLASTVFAPLAALLVNHAGWRGTYLVLAAALAVITVPAHLFGLRRSWPAPPPVPEHGRNDVTAHPNVIARSRRFLLLAVAFSLAGFALSAVAINLVPLLLSRGLSLSAAALALGLGGVGQVVGRLGYGWLTARTTLRTRTAGVLLVSALTCATLGLLPGPVALLIAASILAGTTRGIFTLLRATAVSDRWGTHHYGRLNGLISAPITVAQALAPATGAALAGLLGGYPAAFLVLAVITLVATALAATATPTEAR